MSDDLKKELQEALELKAHGGQNEIIQGPIRPKGGGTVTVHDYRGQREKCADGEHERMAEFRVNVDSSEERQALTVCKYCRVVYVPR